MVSPLFHRWGDGPPINHLASKWPSQNWNSGWSKSKGQAPTPQIQTWTLSPTDTSSGERAPSHPREEAPLSHPGQSADVQCPPQGNASQAQSPPYFSVLFVAPFPSHPAHHIHWMVTYLHLTRKGVKGTSPCRQGVGCPTIHVSGTEGFLGHGTLSASTGTVPGGCSPLPGGRMQRPGCYLSGKRDFLPPATCLCPLPSLSPSPFPGKEHLGGRAQTPSPGLAPREAVQKVKVSDTGPILLPMIIRDTPFLYPP